MRSILHGIGDDDNGDDAVVAAKVIVKRCGTRSATELSRRIVCGAILMIFRSGYGVRCRTLIALASSVERRVKGEW